MAVEPGRNGRWAVAPGGRSGRTAAAAGWHLALVMKSSAGAVVHLFALDSGRRTACLDIPEGVRDLAFSPEGEHLVTAGREQPLVRLWRSSDGASLARVHQNRVRHE